MLDDLIAPAPALALALAPSPSPSPKVEHFLGIIHAKETNAESIAGYLSSFLDSHGISFEKLRGLGFDGASTVIMSGHKTGVKKRLRLFALSALYIHCCCHRLLQMQLLNTKKSKGSWEHYWLSGKHFIIPQRKAEIQAELDSPEIRMQKPSDTRWLARERAIRDV